MALDPDHFRGLPQQHTNDVSTYARLLMPSFLPPGVEKAIWLDADLLVLHDLAELWEVDVSGVALGAVQDMVVLTLSSRLGLTGYRKLGLAGESAYFNAGVLVVNLCWWRSRHVAEQVVDHLRAHPRQSLFPDQEGLNVAAHGAWRPLDPRWNVIASVRGRPFYHPSHLPGDVYRQVIDDPWILHFAGAWKPWRYHNGNPDLPCFFYYVDMTAWRGWRPPRTPKRLALGVYDAYLRAGLYPLEQRAFALTRRGKYASVGMKP
jgi:lipopolysaccharide biosynthesis glycosyltransferase